jgi:ArsR family transcriptional regulator
MSMKDLIKVMKALSDPNRVKILKILQQESLCVCELQAALGIAQPTVSNHLKVLEEAGLVTSRKSGLWVYYFVTDGSRSAYVATILGNLKHWLKDDPEIVRMMGSLPDLKREAVGKRQPAQTAIS